jgi:hypothetical protein
MAIIQLQFRQGPEADRALITPLEGEIIYTTDSKSIYVGDGTTPGGNAPRVPMPINGVADSSNHPASTLFVHSLLSSITGVSTAGFAVKNAVNTFTDVNTFQKYPVVTDTLLPLSDSSNKVATTEWIKSYIGSLSLGTNDNYALKNGANTFTSSNDFTVSPTAPNPAFNDSSNKVATTKFVRDAVRSVGNISTVNILPGVGTTVNYSDGFVTLPNGDTVDVVAGSRVFPNSGTNYLIVNSLGQVSIASSFPTQPDIGVIATVYTSGGLITNISTTGLDLAPYAKLNGSTFTGTVRVPTPSPADDSDAAATTEWVNNKLDTIGLGDGEYATTDWVIQKIVDMLTKPMNADGPPMLYVTEGLHVNVTPGTVNKPTTGICNITTLASDIAIDANSVVYVWIRYSDCSVIVTTTSPDPSIGFLLGVLTTDATKVVDLVIPEAARVETFITRHFRASFGGTLVFIP